MPATLIRLAGRYLAALRYASLPCEIGFPKSTLMTTAKAGRIRARLKARPERGRRLPGIPTVLGPPRRVQRSKLAPANHRSPWRTGASASAASSDSDPRRTHRARSPKLSAASLEEYKLRQPQSRTGCAAARLMAGLAEVTIM
jgi:hypothetical protein